MFRQEGKTASGAPWFKALGVEEYIYYDLGCSVGVPARWIIDEDAPSLTRMHDLDQDAYCYYQGRLDSENSSWPPAHAMWTLLCNNEWEEHMLMYTLITTTTTTSKTSSTTSSTTSTSTTTTSETLTTTSTTTVSSSTTATSTSSSTATSTSSSSSSSSLTTTTTSETSTSSSSSSSSSTSSSSTSSRSTSTTTSSTSTSTSSSSTSSSTGSTTTTSTSSITSSSTSATNTSTTTTLSQTSTTNTTTATTRTTVTTTMTTSTATTSTESSTTHTETETSTTTQNTTSSTTTTTSTTLTDQDGEDSDVTSVTASSATSTASSSTTVSTSTASTSTVTSKGPMQGFIVSGACPDQDFLNGLYFEMQGFTANGAPFYGSGSGYYVYYDVDCNGRGDNQPKWVIDQDKPNASRSQDLDGDNECLYLARVDSINAIRPPTAASWHIYCGSVFEDLKLTLHEQDQAPTTTVTSPPVVPEAAEAVVVSGACSYQEMANGLFILQGTTFSGSPYYKNKESEFHIYWDPDCTGTGGEDSIARWVIDTDAPNVSASSDLDGDRDCKYLARTNSEDFVPPAGAQWLVFCKGGWKELRLQVQATDPANDTTDAPPGAVDASWRLRSPLLALLALLVVSSA